MSGGEHEGKGGGKTPFLIFSEDFREQVRTKLPRLTVHQDMAIVKAKWVMLSKEQR